MAGSEPLELGPSASGCSLGVCGVGGEVYDLYGGQHRVLHFVHYNNKRIPLLFLWFSLSISCLLVKCLGCSNKPISLLIRSTHIAYHKG
jgi:hypothetical protein